MKTVIIIVLTLLFVAGCASSGRQIDTRVVETIEKGKTTRWQLTEKLGPPAMVTLAPDGKRILMYNYTEVRTKAATFIPVVGLIAGGTEGQQQTLQIICDRYGIVEDFLFTNAPIDIRLGP